MKKLIITAALATLFSGAVLAETLPKVLDIPVKAGMKVIANFPAAGGLHGYVLNQAGTSSVVYTTPDGKLLLVGTVIDENGTNLTAEYAQKYIPKPNYDSLLPKLEKSTFFVAGAKGNAAKSTIYAFIDPNCTFCHFAWKALKSYQAAGLQVRWIPVAFLTPDSAGKAAAILESANPEKALDDHETVFNPKDETGGITPIKISDKMKAKLDANAALMREFGINGTPGIVYKDKAGKLVVSNGMPKLSGLPTITGLPEQPQPDPELQRFR